MRTFVTQTLDQVYLVSARRAPRLSGPKAHDRLAHAIGMGAVVLLALLLAIVVSHGCHGEDFDHEPCFIPKLDQEP
jgi:hypothetical protein